MTTIVQVVYFEDSYVICRLMFWKKMNLPKNGVLILYYVMDFQQFESIFSDLMKLRSICVKFRFFQRFLSTMNPFQHFFLYVRQFEYIVRKFELKSVFLCRKLPFLCISGPNLSSIRSTSICKEKYSRTG